MGGSDDVGDERSLSLGVSGQVPASGQDDFPFGPDGSTEAFGSDDDLLHLGGLEFRFHGSAGTLVLTAPIVGLSATADGGYWFRAPDDGLFVDGDVHFSGAPGGGRRSGRRHRPLSPPTADRGHAP